VNARRAPKRIGYRHLSDQIPDFGTHTRSTGLLSPGNPDPEKPEPLPMPADNCLRSHYQQGFSPMGPDS
jgi:hypothetical protein